MLNKTYNLKLRLFCSALIIVVSSFVTLNQVGAATPADGAANYLDSQFTIADGIGGPAISDWAAMGMAAAGRRRPELAAYIERQALNLTNQPATSVERTILALIAADRNPRQLSNGTDLVALLKSHHLNNQTGLVGLLNDDIFAILALISAGESINDPQVADSLAYLINHQFSNGGFSWSVAGVEDCNNTAVAIQALVLASRAGADTAHSLSKAAAYLESCQNEDGGFGYQPGQLSDGASTSWAINALIALKKDVNQQLKNGLNPYDHLATLKHSGGGYGWQSNEEPNLLVSAYATIALAGKSLPVAIFRTPETTPLPTPTVSPAVSASPSPMISPSVSPSAIPSAGPIPSASPTTLPVVPAPSPLPSPTPSPSPMPSPSPTPASSVSPTPATPSPSPSPWPSPSPSPQPSESSTSTPTPRADNTPSQQISANATSKTFSNVSEIQLSEDSEASVEYTDHSSPAEKARRAVLEIIKPYETEEPSEIINSPEAGNETVVENTPTAMVLQSNKNRFAEAAVAIGLGLILTGWGLRRLFLSRRPTI